VTQGETFTVPCMPTMPDINVTLWREMAGSQQIHPDKYVTFNPKVRKNGAIFLMDKNTYNDRLNVKFQQVMFWKKNPSN
jgi:hypothetical protein